MKVPKSLRSMMLTHAFLCIALMMQGSAVGAAGTQRQKEKENKHEHTVIGLHIYVPVEYYGIDAGNLNKYMGVAELPQVRVPSILVGLGTQVQIDRIVVNMSFSTGGKRYNLDNARLSAPFSTYGFTIGYDLKSSPYVNLQPYAGFRMGRAGYNYENLTSPPASGSTAPDQMKFRGNRGMLDLGVGISLQSRFLVGVRSGVLLPIGRTRWKSGDGAQLSEGPDLSYRYYIGLNFGFGRANIKVKNTMAATYNESEPSLSSAY
jgi:hypothetical protein